MIKVKTLIFSFLINIFLLSCSANKISLDEFKQTKLSVAAQKEDFEILKSALEEAHPGLYWYQEKEQFNRKADSLRKSFLAETDIRTYFRKVSPFITSIKCGHTRLLTPTIKLTSVQKKYYKALGDAPVQQFNYLIDDKERRLLISKNNSADSSIKIGAEILAINDMPIKKICGLLENTFSSDGENLTFYNRALEKSFSAFYTQYYGREDSLLFKIKEEDKITAHWIKNKASADKKAQEIADPAKKKELIAANKKLQKEKKLNAYKGYDNNKKPLLNLSIDSVQNYKTAILTVKSFSFEKNDHARFFKESFAEIKQQNVVNLIVDMRGNGGGNLSACYDLFRYLYDKPYRFTDKAEIKKKNYEAEIFFDKRLKYGFLYKLSQLRKDETGYFSKLPTDKTRPPHLNNFKGNLYVLINGFSFSATTLLSANLQGLKRGVFIGEETGGGYNQCSAGTLPLLTLPNSHVKLRLPLKKISPLNKRNLQGRGVFPQVVVETTATDLLSNNDPVMGKAKEIIYKQRNLSSQND